MTITILGSGTSGGIPMIGCSCPVCLSDDIRDKRLRTSILISINGKNVAIDAGPDFRQQMLREKVKSLDAIIFTHAHRDHTAGLDDVRAFNHFQQKPLDVYATEAVQTALKMEYYYIFSDKWYPGLPQINFITITNKPFKVGDIQLMPVEVLHFKMQVFGYRIKNFTYITDANFIGADELEKIKGSELLIINALRKEKHISHFNLQEALAIAAEVGADKTYLTHIAHQMGSHEQVQAELPPRVFLAYDGLRLETK